MNKKELINKMRKALADLNLLTDAIFEQITDLEDSIKADRVTTDYSEANLGGIDRTPQPGDVIQFPDYEEMVVMKQQLRPGSEYCIYLVQVKWNNIDSFINMNKIRYTPHNNLKCISSFQQKLIKINLLTALKELSGKTVECVYHSIDMVPTFNVDGTRCIKYRRLNGEIIAEPVLRPKLVPFIINQS